MSQIVTRTVNGGKTTLTGKPCSACGLTFWQGPNDCREECVDCNPPDDGTEDATVGRDYKRPQSESQYHGAGYRD